MFRPSVLATLLYRAAALGSACIALSAGGGQHPHTPPATCIPPHNLTIAHIPILYKKPNAPVALSPGTFSYTAYSQQYTNTKFQMTLTPAASQKQFYAPGGQGRPNNGWPYQLTLGTAVTITPVKPPVSACAMPYVQTLQQDVNDSNYTPINSDGIPYVCVASHWLVRGCKHPTPVPHSVVVPANVRGSARRFLCEVQVQSSMRSGVVLVDCVVTSGPGSAHKLLRSPSGRWPYRLRLHGKLTATFRVRLRRRIRKETAVLFTALRVCPRSTAGPQGTVWFTP